MIRVATLHDAEAICGLIRVYAERDQMLPRFLPEIQQNISTFLVYERDGRIVGVCSLRKGWERLVEVRSLAVDPGYYRQGIATELVKQAIVNASDCETIFVLTYVTPLFSALGFQVVAKESLPHKIWNDCRACRHQEDCDEIAMVLSLAPVRCPAPAETLTAALSV